MSIRSPTRVQTAASPSQSSPLALGQVAWPRTPSIPQQWPSHRWRATHPAIYLPERSQASSSESWLSSSSLRWLSGSSYEDVEGEDRKKRKGRKTEHPTISQVRIRLANRSIRDMRTIMSWSPSNTHPLLPLAPLLDLGVMLTMASRVQVLL